MNIQKKITQKIAAIVCLLVCISLSFCSKDASSLTFKDIENELNGKFGDNAYYTNITVSYTKQLGMLFNVTVTKDPASLQLEEWTWTQNTWTQKSEITLEITGGSPTEFMFSLSDEVKLSKLDALLKQSIQKLKDEKKFDGILSVAHIQAPRNGDKTKLDYNISLEPENGGTTFHFSYDLKGTLTDFSY